MSFAIKNLSDLLRQERVLYGVVVAVHGEMVHVATPRGGVHARAMDHLQAGDRVKIDGGLATKAPVGWRIYSV
jgi:hypothetical protein